MHRFILNPPDNVQIDHIDLNGLNNQRSNLRLATSAQNAQNKILRSDNTSGYKGIWRRENGRWSAEVVANGVRSYAGSFETAEQAAVAYDAHAIATQGRFANINFPDGNRLPEQLPEPALPNAAKQFCPQGHPYDEENTEVRTTARGGPFRVCKACHRSQANDRYQANRRDFLAAGNVSNACADRTHCKYGHPFEGENLIIKTHKKTGKTQRVCRTCKNEGLTKANRARAERKKTEKAQVEAAASGNVGN